MVCCIKYISFRIGIFNTWNRVYQPFTNPARADDLVLNHWIKSSEANEGSLLNALVVMTSTDVVMK